LQLAERELAPERRHDREVEGLPRAGDDDGEHDGAEIGPRHQAFGLRDLVGHDVLPRRARPHADA